MENYYPLPRDPNAEEDEAGERGSDTGISGISGSAVGAGTAWVGAAPFLNACFPAHMPCLLHGALATCSLPPILPHTHTAGMTPQTATATRTFRWLRWQRRWHGMRWRGGTRCTAGPRRGLCGTENGQSRVSEERCWGMEGRGRPVAWGSRG